MDTTTRAPGALPTLATAPAIRIGAPPARSDADRAGQRSGPFDSIFNLARMTLAVLFGMVLGAFICAALGF